MSLNNFIPEVWAVGILRNLHKAQVFAQPNVCNRDYEGEIKQKGDTVRITAIGAITVSDYTKDTDIAAPQALTDGQEVLTIDHAKYFNFAVDDVDQAQSNNNFMGEGMFEAGYAMSNTQDTFVAGLYTDAASGNFVGTDASPSTITVASDLYPLLTKLKVKLDEANVPDDGRRWCVLPPWAEAVMDQDNRFVLNLNPATFGTLLNGQVGKAAGFNLLKSNNVTFQGVVATGDYRIMAGHPMAITFAEQINKVEAYRPPLRFSDAVKGLNLFGGKVARPQALAVLTLTRNLA
jgi:hypothetical protein